MNSLGVCGDRVAESFLKYGSPDDFHRVEAQWSLTFPSRRCLAQASVGFLFPSREIDVQFDTEVTYFLKQN